MRIITAMILTLLLIACGEANRPNDEQGTDLLESQRKVMEDAKDVEDELQKALDERMKDLDQQQ